MNIASLGNEAICDGQRSYMRWASKIYSFFCLFFVFKRTLILQIYTNESGGLCCLRVSHTDNTEDTDEA